jgi:hypothetical protein
LVVCPSRFGSARVSCPRLRFCELRTEQNAEQTLQVWCTNISLTASDVLYCSGFNSYS